MVERSLAPGQTPTPTPGTSSGTRFTDRDRRLAEALARGLSSRKAVKEAGFRDKNAAARKLKDPAFRRLVEDYEAELYRGALRGFYKSAILARSVQDAIMAAYLKHIKANPGKWLEGARAAAAVAHKALGVAVNVAELHRLRRRLDELDRLLHDGGERGAGSDDPYGVPYGEPEGDDGFAEESVSGAGATG